MVHHAHIIAVQLIILVSCLATVLCKELVGRTRSNPENKGGDGSYSSAEVFPPKHIMKLMQQLSKNQDLLKERGNTVRSYLPNMSFACNDPTYVFSITPHKTESLRSVELHYFASKPSIPIGSRPTIDIHLYLITDTSSACQPIGVQQRPAGARAGWQVADVTAQIAHLVKPTEQGKVTVGVSFRLQETGRSRETSRGHIADERVLSNHARPFLLVYAEDDDSSGNSVLQWTQGGAKTKTAPSEATRPKARSPTQAQLHSRHARSADGNVHSILTNEFPEGNTNIAQQATFHHFNEQDSKRRKAKKRTSKKRGKRSSKRHRKTPLMDESSSVVEEETEEQAGTNKDRDQNTVLPMSPSDGTCSRHPMFVSFDTIDWDGYVIAPAGFDAFYCAGACSFPLSKTDNASNHATIQSVMSVAGVQAKIPPPCCVPEQLSSLSILFLDAENDNVGLKNYRNMVVESCGCR